MAEDAVDAVAYKRLLGSDVNPRDEEWSQATYGKPSQRGTGQHQARPDCLLPTERQARLSDRAAKAIQKTTSRASPVKSARRCTVG